MLHVYIDADACPVKEETYRVATRYGLAVTLVANSSMRTPENIELVVVGEGLDVADDWIAEHVESGDLVVTSDVLLAARCLAKGASVVSTYGKALTAENIGETVATRNLLAELRGGGEITGGPPPIQKKDRSRFLQTLDAAIRVIMRETEK